MKNEKKNLVQNLKWATAHLSRRLGAGLGCWACRRWAGVGRVRGVRGQCRGALGWGAGRSQAGTAGVRGQCRGALGWGAGRAQAGTAGVRGRWAWRAGRRAWVRGRRRQAAAARELSKRVGVRGRRGAGELGVRGRRGAGALGVSGRRGVGAWGAGHGRSGRGRAAWAPGRNLVHSTHFRSVLTRFFS